MQRVDWWMLGLESNRWYYYDGRDWVAANPPGYDERRVRGSAVRTETDLQQVVDSRGPPGTAPGPVQFENDELPLPARVSQEDVGATLVSPSAAFMEPLRRSEAPTVPKGLESEANTLQYSRPVRDQGPGLTQPTRPDAADAMQQTMPHAAGHARETQEAGRVDPLSAQTVTHGSPVVGAAVSAAPGAAVSRPKPKLGEFPQPDYSPALGMSRNRSTYTKWGIRFAVLGVVGGMALTLLVLVGMVGYYFYKVNQYQGAVNTLSERAANFETTEIYDASGTLLAEFSNLENENSGQRKSVTLDQISPWLIHATIATENETFYTDPGFSVFAIVRAAVQNLQAGGTVSGASTITQQLARALVLDTEFATQRTTERKIVEVIVASEIKRKYSKNEILQIYLNEIFYGNLSYGIEAAAQTYFNKSASELNPAEAAFLAGLPQSPATYDPVINREAAMARMDDVLRLMSEANGTGCITIEHEDHTRWAVPNGGTLCITARMAGDGDPVYYYQAPGMAAPEELTLDIAYVKTQAYNPPQFRARHPHFVNYVWQQLEDTYGSQAIYSAGFRVYTTLDEDIQNAAEESVTATLAEVNARGFDVDNASVVAMRPSDGAVMAMVGSADYNNEEIDGQVNVAFTAQQPGSSIKPFVYLAALERQGDEGYWTPATIIWDTPTNFNGYAPTNYDLMFRGPVNVRNSLANSLNVPAVKTLQFVTLERFTELAKRIGLRFPLGDPVERGAGLPTALGAVEVRLFDMTSAYAMLANNGRRVDPYSIVYIQDHQGNEVYRADTSPEGMRVVEPQYAYLLTSILSDNEARAAEFGRGFPLELTNGRIAAVKTGTTNDNRDTWTVGYTPQMVVGVWMGNTDNHPMGSITGWGSSAHIWNAVMEKAHEGEQVQDFNPPDGLIQAEVCQDSGALPSSGTCLGGTYWEIFAASAPPPEASESLFQELQVDGYTGRLVNDHCRDWLETRTYLVLDDPTAYDWINNSPGGNQWATMRGLEPPLSPPPTDYCDPNEARPILVLSSPGENQTVEGTITLRGAVSMPQFNRYEIRYGTGHDPEAFSQPVIVETSQRPEGESVLGEFDTRQLAADGPYTIRLIGIDNYGRSVHRDVHITVRLPEPTPTPTSLPTPTLAPTQPGVASTPAPDGSISIQGPTEAPTLTPTWTLTPTPQ